MNGSARGRDPGRRMIEIRAHEDLRDPGLASAWDSLTRDGGCPGLFSSRPWVEAWARSFAGRTRPLILVGTEGDKPVGIAPFFAAGGTAEFPVNFLSHRGEMVVREGDADAFGAAALAHLRGRRMRASLRSVPDGSPTARALGVASRGAGYLRLEEPGRVSPYVDIAGSWDEYYASRTRHVTHEWERKIRKIQRAGSVAVRGLSPESDLDALVREFVAVESKSWKEEEGTSISGRGVESFYLDLTRDLAAAGLFRPFWLEMDGRAVAFLYGAVFGGTYFALKTSFDEASSKLSPGVLLFHEAIRDAFETGLSRFDFVGQTARWKEEWATGKLAHRTIALYPTAPSGLASYALDAWVKPAARRALRKAEARS